MKVTLCICTWKEIIFYLLQYVSVVKMNCKRKLIASITLHRSLETSYCKLSSIPGRIIHKTATSKPRIYAKLFSVLRQRMRYVFRTKQAVFWFSGICNSENPLRSGLWADLVSVLTPQSNVPILSKRKEIIKGKQQCRQHHQDKKWQFPRRVKLISFSHRATTACNGNGKVKSSDA